MRWLNGVSGAGVEGLGADVAYIQHAAHALDVDGLAHLTRREHDCAEALQANKQMQRRPRKQTEKTQTNKQKPPKTKQAGTDERKQGIAFKPWLLRITHCYRWSLARPAWHGMAWHGADQAATLAAKSARIGQRGA